MFRLPAAQGCFNHDPGFHLSCDEHLSKGWGPPLPYPRWRRRTALFYREAESLYERVAIERWSAVVVGAC